MSDDMEDLQDTYPGAGTFMFGDTAKSTAAQTELVRAGKKSANCEAAAEFTDDPAALPKVGRCDIAANWDGSPALVIRTTQVDEVRFCDVTLDMAQADGPYHTLKDWRKAREAYFQRSGGFAHDMPLIFEHFEVVEDLNDR